MPEGKEEAWTSNATQRRKLSSANSAASRDGGTSSWREVRVPCPLYVLTAPGCAQRSSAAPPVAVPECANAGGGRLDRAGRGDELRVLGDPAAGDAGRPHGQAAGRLAGTPWRLGGPTARAARQARTRRCPTGTAAQHR